MTAIESMHSLSNLKNVDTFDYMEDTVFMIKRNQAIYTEIVCVISNISFNKQCNRDGILQIPHSYHQHC